MVQNRPPYQRVHLVADTTERAQAAANRLTERYGWPILDGSICALPDASEEQPDVIVALGGDGFLLHTLHCYLESDIPIYGMHRGTVGFLMNDYHEDDLMDALTSAVTTVIHPLRMVAHTGDGKETQALAINEVSLFRKTGQAAKIRITVDDVVHMEEVICDGIMAATPAGSTAYNLSAGGPILPIRANLLAITPISAFRPRRWKGALVPENATIRFDVLEHEKRPTNASADFIDVENVKSVEIREAPSKRIRLLFDRGHSLEERILREQFTV